MSLATRMMLALWIPTVLAAGCGTNKGAAKTSNTVAVRTVTYRGPIWAKKPQSQKFVQVQAPVWNNSGSPPPPENSVDATPPLPAATATATAAPAATAPPPKDVADARK